MCCKITDNLSKKVCIVAQISMHYATCYVMLLTVCVTMYILYNEGGIWIETVYFNFAWIIQRLQTKDSVGCIYLVSNHHEPG